MLCVWRFRPSVPLAIVTFFAKKLSLSLAAHYIETRKGGQACYGVDAGQINVNREEFVIYRIMDKTEKQSLQNGPNLISQTSAGQNNQFPVRYQLNNDRLQSAAFLAKSLSDGNRLKILLLISSGRKSVSAIVEESDLSQPLVSHHLKELKRSLLVKVEREGPFIYYELADVRILDVLQTLSNVATDLLSDRKTF